MSSKNLAKRLAILYISEKQQSLNLNPTTNVSIFVAIVICILFYQYPHNIIIIFFCNRTVNWLIYILNITD